MRRKQLHASPGTWGHRSVPPTTVSAQQRHAHPGIEAHRPVTPHPAPRPATGRTHPYQPTRATAPTGTRTRPRTQKEKKIKVTQVAPASTRNNHRRAAGPPGAPRLGRAPSQGPGGHRPVSARQVASAQAGKRTQLRQSHRPVTPTRVSPPGVQARQGCQRKFAVRFSRGDPQGRAATRGAYRGLPPTGACRRRRCRPGGAGARAQRDETEQEGRGRTASPGSSARIGTIGYATGSTEG
jgi:hypothetical protein